MLEETSIKADRDICQSEEPNMSLKAKAIEVTKGALL